MTITQADEQTNWHPPEPHQGRLLIGLESKKCNAHSWKTTTYYWSCQVKFYMTLQSNKPIRWASTHHNYVVICSEVLFQPNTLHRPTEDLLKCHHSCPASSSGSHFPKHNRTIKNTPTMYEGTICSHAQGNNMRQCCKLRHGYTGCWGRSENTIVSLN